MYLVMGSDEQLDIKHIGNIYIYTLQQTNMVENHLIFDRIFMSQATTEMWIGIYSPYQYWTINSRITKFNYCVFFNPLV